MKKPLADKEPILLLVHRIPYPPNKGDKIRSFNLLKFLSKTFDVYLGAFIDDPEDKKYISKVAEFCKETCLIEINPRKRKIASLSGFFTNKALSIPYYKNTQMQSWVNDTVSAKAIKKHLVYSSPMAQYLQTMTNAELKVIDFVDVDSEKWQQYSEKHSGLMRWVYAREARQLLKFEKQIADEFDCSFFVSKNEANLFRQLAPEVDKKITYYSNGVDTAYFSPAIELENPYSAHGKNAQIMVFTGAMDYWANQEAVIWFAETIFPTVQENCPDACFYIVGSRPSEKIKRLAEKDGVFVTGGVNDIRPYIAFAHLVTAPLRIARGIQNKVLEAMAMAKPVVATYAAMDGIASSFNTSCKKNSNDEFKSYTSSSAEELAQICEKILLEGDHRNLGDKGRELVISHFSWDSHLAKITKYLTKVHSS